MYDEHTLRCRDTFFARMYNVDVHLSWMECTAAVGQQHLGTQAYWHLTGEHGIWATQRCNTQRMPPLLFPISDTTLNTSWYAVHNHSLLNDVGAAIAQTIAVHTVLRPDTRARPCHCSTATSWEPHPWSVFQSVHRYHCAFAPDFCSVSCEARRTRKGTLTDVMYLAA